MNNQTFGRLFFILLTIINTPLFAVDWSHYVNNLQSHFADPSASSTLLGIMESCGNLSNINDDCVLKGLERVAVQENNTYAKAIAHDYYQALAEGHFNTYPECQIETHWQANRIIGHCILLMNYYALKEKDKETAAKYYEMCLQGGMQGLVYQGNVVAQYFLSNIYTKRGLIQAAQVWKRTLKLRKDTEEYRLMKHCYR